MCNFVKLFQFLYVSRRKVFKMILWLIKLMCFVRFWLCFKSQFYFGKRNKIMKIYFLGRFLCKDLINSMYSTNSVFCDINQFVRLPQISKNVLINSIEFHSLQIIIIIKFLINTTTIRIISLIIRNKPIKIIVLLPIKSSSTCVIRTIKMRQI